MRTFAWLLAIFIGGAAPITPALADEDGGAWLSVGGSGAVNDDVTATAFVQARLIDDAQHLVQVFATANADTSVSDRARIGAGYAYMLTDPIGGTRSNEHRPYQYVWITLTDAGAPITLRTRTQIEERFREESGGLALRLRQLVVASYPLNHALTAVVWTEPFVHVTQPDWLDHDGIDQWRNFVGMDIKTGSIATLRAGYLNQHIFLRGEDRTNHLASVGLRFAL